MDYYNMMYGRVRHEELIAEAQREHRVVMEESTIRVNPFIRIAAAVQRILALRSVARRPSQQLAVK